MLQPTPYPSTEPQLHKLNVFEEQSKALNQHHNFYRPPLTTFFSEGYNAAGVKMNASTGAGNDCTGVNDGSSQLFNEKCLRDISNRCSGSKNSILMTYLPDAWNWGAEIFCEVDVAYIRPDKTSGHSLVYYTYLGGEKSKKAKGQELMWVRVVSVT
jgi:hypothetical protein